MNHRHKAKTVVTIGYRHTARGADEDRRAHGAVCHVETCECGAKRETNTNGCYDEQGKWYAP